MDKNCLTFSLLFPVLVLMGIGCSVKNPIRNQSVVPLLSGLAVADTLFLDTAAGSPVSVNVEDPQGWNDINRVVCIVFSTKPVSEQALQDDGANGDIIPQDGVFYGTLTKASFESAAGDFRIGIAAEDAEGNPSDTLFATVVVVAGERNERPDLSDPVAPDTVRSDSLNSLFFSVHASDPQGLSDVQSVYFDLFPPSAVVSSHRGVLRDDGSNGDAFPDDGIFSLRWDFSGTLKTIGLHQVRFEAQDKKGAKSIPQVRAFYVIGVNGPPVLSDLSVPGEVSRQSSRPILLTVRASDPQGPQDIERVYFNSTKPDGSPASGNPFQMVDDGTLGDQSAGDGVYSRNIIITSQNALGVYQFEFFAEDVSGAVSASLVHNITVVDAILD